MQSWQNMKLLPIDIRRSRSIRCNSPGSSARKWHLKSRSTSMIRRSIQQRYRGGCDVYSVGRDTERDHDYYRPGGADRDGSPDASESSAALLYGGPLT